MKTNLADFKDLLESFSNAKRDRNQLSCEFLQLWLGIIHCQNGRSRHISYLQHEHENFCVWLFYILLKPLRYKKYFLFEETQGPTGTLAWTLVQHFPFSETKPERRIKRKTIFAAEGQMFRLHWWQGKTLKNSRENVILYFLSFRC